MKSNLLRIGGNVDAWCTRCKLTLAHTIEAMVGQEIKRVSCNTCQGKHLFRPTPSSTVSVVSKKPISEPRDWTLAQDYSFQNHYKVGALLKHPDFGFGIVKADKGNRKLEVVFDAGSKILLHAQA